MLGPVLTQELLLGSRRSRQQIFRRIYAGWLMLQLLGFCFSYFLGRASAMAGSFVETLIAQQFAVLLIATPAITAGAVTDEKSRGTLQYLLTAGLTGSEIVLGKLLGRAVQVALLLLAGLPLICFLGVFCGLGLTALLALCASTVAPLFGVGALSLLASVWSRHTRDAVLGVYTVGGLAALGLWAADLTWLFDPLYVLEPAWGDADVVEMLRRLAVSALAWGGVGAVCLGLAVWRLRGAYIRQLEGEGRRKTERWWRARRAAVSDEPLRWKERHVEGIAPLAGLRRFPRWLGMLLIALVTAASSVAILATHLDSAATPQQVFRLLGRGDLLPLMTMFPGAAAAFLWQSVVAMVVATLIIGIRCSGAVTGERERQTWEALLLTPLTTQQLIRAKLWGIIGASYPYLAAYALPALLLAVLAGPPAVVLTLLGLAGTWLAMWSVGATGLYTSVRAKGSWRSLLGTLGVVYAGGFILFIAAFPVIIMMYVLLSLLVLAFDHFYSTQFGTILGWSLPGFVLGSWLTLVGVFLLLAWYFLNDAEKYVADRERVRHWKDEPKPLPRGRRPLKPRYYR